MHTSEDAAPAAPKKILYLADSYWGTAWYRCHAPGLALHRRGYSVVLSDELNEHDVTTADIVVLERLFHPELMPVIQHSRARGALVVFDLDDDYWNIKPDNPAYQAWADGRLLRGMEQVMRACDLVTVPTKTLADRVKHINPRVRVLPNMLPAEHWAFSPNDVGRPVEEGLVLGWAGSSSHQADLSVVIDVVVQLLDRYPKLEFQVAGATADWLPDHPRIMLLEPVRIERYPQLLQGFDLAIAPLLDNRFNQAKSDLKIIEYGMVGLPMVASKVGPYVETVRHGENGMLASNAKDWLKHLSALIESPDLRVRLGAEARRLAESRLIHANIDRWERAYGLLR